MTTCRTPQFSETPHWPLWKRELPALFLFSKPFYLLDVGQLFQSLDTRIPALAVPAVWGARCGTKALGGGAGAGDLGAECQRMPLPPALVSMPPSTSFKTKPPSSLFFKRTTYPQLALPTKVSGYHFTTKMAEGAGQKHRNRPCSEQARFPLKLHTRLITCLMLPNIGL